MFVYIIIFLVVVGWYVANPGKSTSTRGLVIAMSALCLFVGFADMLGGYDRYIYGELFDGLADYHKFGVNIQQSQIFTQYPKELCYDYWNYLVSFVTMNRYIFILLTTILIYVLMFFSIRDYVENYPFAIILFLALTFFFTFTYLRQMIGASIAWLSVRYIIQRDWKKYLIVVLIAYGFHNSALIFLPAYWIPVRKLAPKTVILGMALIFILGMTGLPSALFSAYGEASDMEERAQSYAQDTSGFRVAYFLEAGFFLWLILKNYKSIAENNKTIVFLNLSLAFCAILLFFIRSENGGRLGWYYMIGVISTVTYLCTRQCSISSRTLGIIALSTLLYVRILVAWGPMLSPYKTFLTPGVRNNDIIYKMFEYDKAYAKNKFYRK